MKNISKIVFVIIGTLIGAGFASGQEMYVFFFSYGINGVIGIIFSSVLMGIVIYKTLELLDKYEIKNYKDFLDILLIKKDKKFNKNKYIIISKEIINVIINIFVLVTFFIMISGFGAYFEQEFGINSLIGSGILALLCFCIFLTNVKGVIKANELIVPILITFLIIIGCINLFSIDILNLGKYIIRTNESNFLISSVIYCSYNSILLIPILITIREYIKSKKQIISISVITTSIIIILSIMVYLLLVKVDVDISKLEMPAVYVVSNMSKILRLIYGIIILGSIFTTSISLGVSFLENTSKNRKSYTQIATIMCITSVIISKFGFSNLINLLYPIFGYLGLIQIWMLLRK